MADVALMLTLYKDTIKKKKSQGENFMGPAVPGNVINNVFVPSFYLGLHF